MKNVTRIVISILFCCFSTVFAQEEALWTRYPAISPDGSTVAFCYKGDIFKVSSEGGFAVQLTTNTAYDFHPVWSNDGKTIAFASNRNGNFDIYTMSSEGGTPKRLTYWSGSEIPLSFSANDQTIYFRSKIMTDPDFSLMSTSGIGETYTVDLSGNGRPTLFTPVYMESIDFNKKETALLYYDMKGYEDKWRKHHTSSVTRDVWLYDLNTKTHTQLSDFVGENRNPVFDPTDNNNFYYLNEKSGSFNIYKRTLNTKNEQQLTHHKEHPVRFLSVADNGLLCYFFDGSIYTLKEDGQPKKLDITIRTDKTEADYKVEFRKGGISEMAVSPNGKEIAFIIRGDVYVTSADFATTMRVTNTAEQERDVSFSPDGRSLVYASERNGCWNVYVSELVRDDDKYFTYAKEIKEKQITKSDVASFQPAFSPDGKEIAFLENRTTLKVINLKSEKTRTILSSEYNYSYSDGDQWYEWSPDGKWFAVNFFEKGGWNNTDVGMVKADGSGEIHNLTQSGYTDSGGGWELDGKALLWYSDRNGMRSHGSWGSQRDIFIQFFDQEAFDKFTATKEEAALVKEREEEAKKGKDKKEKEKEKDSTKIALPEITYDIVNAENRIVRLTLTSASHGSCFLSKDADKLYYFAAFEKGFDLWVRDFKENTTKLLAKLGAGYAHLDSDKDKKKLFMLSNGTISKIDIDKGTTKAVEINAEYTYKPEQERDYIFNHAWQQVIDKFYDPEIHGLDWNMYREFYTRFLPHINNNFDFSEMLGELLGELNASHTGASYRTSQSGDRTAVLGMFFDKNHTGDGLKIAEILEKNPMIKTNSKIKEGVIILKIDGNEIKAGEDYFRYLNHKTQKNTLLTLSDGKKQWEEVVKPISSAVQNELLYQRWVKQREKLVEKLSDGKVGYVHVRGMDGQSFRKVFSDVLGKNRNKEAIVIDTRFNGGGWLHDDLATFFNGKHYADFVPRGQYIASEPWNKWYKKSAVVMNEGNYSDAHGFPFTYKALEIGKLIGMPVPGTMTAVWWETQIDNSLVFGIPQVGVKDLEGDYLENKQLMPDILINNDPNSMTEGRDLQIEAAVKHLLEEIKK